MYLTLFSEQYFKIGKMMSVIRATILFGLIKLMMNLSIARIQ